MGIVAFKYLTSEQCFISHFTEETLEAGTKILRKLENKVVNESSLVTFWASDRVLPPKLLFRLAGKRIAEFCKTAASFLVTSSGNDEPVKLRRKRETTAEGKPQKGQFAHKSYGHYGHQSLNYAHYGHETYTGGQSSSAGELTQKVEQVQTRGHGPSTIPSAGITHQFSPPGSNGHVGGSSNGGSEGFALRTGYEGGYQISQPLGLRAGSQFRGGLSSQGQYVTGSAISPPGTSARFLPMPGLASRGDTISGFPGMPMGSPAGLTTPGMPRVPSARPTEEKPTYQESRDFRRDAQPGFPSPGIVSPRDTSLLARWPSLPGYPAAAVSQPGLALDTEQPAYHIRREPQCCQQKTEGHAAVLPGVSRTPAASDILQTGYVPSGRVTTQTAYPTTGISQELHPVNGAKPPDYRPPAIASPSAYPSLGIPAPIHRIPQTAHPGLLSAQTATAITPGQAPCCQPKIQQPETVDTEAGIHPTMDMRIRPDYPRPPSPRVDHPSAITTPTGYPHPPSIQPLYPSPGMQPSYPPPRMQPSYSPPRMQPGYLSPGMQPCCQPEVQPPGTITSAADISAVTDVRYTETSPVHFPQVVLQPGHPPSGMTGLPSQALPVPPAHPSQHTVQQVYPVPPPTPGIPACCQPKVQPGSTFTGAPLIPGKDQTDIRRPDHAYQLWKYTGYPPSTQLPHPDHLPSSLQQPIYSSPVVPPRGFPSPDTGVSAVQPGYPLYPGQQQPERIPFVSPQQTYVPLPGVPHPDYPSRDVKYPAYPSSGPIQHIYPSPGAVQPSTGIIPPASISPGSQPEYLPPRTVHPVHPGYPAHPRRTVPDYKPSETAVAQVGGAEHLIPGTPGTYLPGTALPSVRTFLPVSAARSVTGEGILTPPGQIEIPRDGLVSVRSKDDTAVSQTQVQTGYEGTAAEATSIGRQGRLGAQTQVQGGYTGNGSFSAQAQSGFTGGVTQSQVRGGKQGGSSGSSSQVERVGSAQSQVQVGRPSGAATGTAQGRFVSGVTQVQAQSGRRGGSAGAQAQSMGTSNSQVQVNVGEGEAQSENGFQGGVSASVSGGYFGGQAHTQLQGGYDSGRTYAATAQGGFDSTSEFRGTVPGVGTIPGMLVSPLNGRLQPPTGSTGAEYMQPSTTGVLGLPQVHTSRPADHLRFRPSEADRVYQRDYRLQNGSVGIPINGIPDYPGIGRTTEESRRLYVPSISQLPAVAMTSIPGPVYISVPEQQTHLRYPGLDESVQRSSVPGIPSTLHIPPSHPVQLNGMPERGIFRPTHPGFVPGVLSPTGQRTATEQHPERIPVSTGLQPSARIPGAVVIPGSVPISIDFNEKHVTPHGHVPGQVGDRQLIPDLLHPDRAIQTHRLSPSHPSAQFPYDQQQIRPPQETSRPSPHVPATAAKPVVSPHPTESRNISRDTSLPLPPTPVHAQFPTSTGNGIPDCCKPKRDWRTRCCQSPIFQQNGISGVKPRCCSSKQPDEDDQKHPDDDSDFDDDAEDTKDSCRIVKAVCYLVYKPSGRARICKPTGTRGC